MDRRRFVSLALPSLLSGALSLIPGCRSEQHINPELTPGDPRAEADYILACQNHDSLSPIYGAINNVYPRDGYTWIVPRENGLAIIALLTAADLTGDPVYQERALIAGRYLTALQQSDGAWCDRYEELTPKTLSKSPTQTAEVMIALARLHQVEFYTAIRDGAEYLISCQNTQNKAGQDDGLICGGKSQDGKFHTSRWTQDNAFGYTALIHAADQATQNGDMANAVRFIDHANQILTGINKYCKDSIAGAWYRKIDQNGVPDSDFYDWGCYSPVMIGVPAEYNAAEVANFILEKFVIRRNDAEDPLNWAVIQNTGEEGAARISPGFGFQAAIALTNLGYPEIAKQIVATADRSGLWCNDCTPKGGWIDWRSTDGQDQAAEWQRFIDTSFYSIVAHQQKKFFF